MHTIFIGDIKQSTQGLHIVRTKGADAQSRQRDALRRAIDELERDQDALLDRMANELTPPAPTSSS